MASVSRMWQLALLALISLSGVWLIAPFKLHVLLWLVSKIFLAGYCGYWMDRYAFPYARPHTQKDGTLSAACMVRRAIVMGAFMLAIGLGQS